MSNDYENKHPEQTNKNGDYLEHNDILDNN